MAKSEIDIWRAHPGPQTDYLKRKEDEVFFGGAKGPGKTDCLLNDSVGSNGPGELADIEKPNYRAIILRRSFPQLQDIIDRAHRRFDGVAKWSGKEMRFTFESGATIGFGHCNHEENKRRYWGQEYQFIGFDQLEEFTETQFKFISLSNRTSDPSIRCRIRATGNPGGLGHWWVKRRFVDGHEPGKPFEMTFKLPDGRTAVKTVIFVRATYKDNPSLTSQYLTNLMDQSDIDRQANMEGDWNIYASQSIFDQKGLAAQQTKVRNPRWIGELVDVRDDIRLEANEHGRLKMYETMEDGEEYIIGSDVGYGDMPNAEQGTGGDPSSIHVINKRTWDVVATWHGWEDPTTFARILYRVGVYYNAALIAVEVNGPGSEVLRTLDKLGYVNLYRHQPEKVGWLTNIQTRNSLIVTGQAIIRQMAADILDQETLDEFYNFIRKENARIEARSGCYDDRVMSLLIAWQVARVNPFEKPNPRKTAFGGGEEGSSMEFIGGRQRARRSGYDRSFRRRR